MKLLLLLKERAITDRKAVFIGLVLVYVKVVWEPTTNLAPLQAPYIPFDPLHQVPYSAHLSPSPSRPTSGTEPTRALQAQPYASCRSNYGHSHTAVALGPKTLTASVPLARHERASVLRKVPACTCIATHGRKRGPRSQVLLQPCRASHGNAHAAGEGDLVRVSDVRPRGSKRLWQGRMR